MGVAALLPLVAKGRLFRVICTSMGHLYGFSAPRPCRHQGEPLRLAVLITGFHRSLACDCSLVGNETGISLLAIRWKAFLVLRPPQGSPQVSSRRAVER